MSDGTEVVTWKPFAAGCVAIAAGAFALGGGKALMLPRHHQELPLRKWAWSKILLGLFVLLETRDTLWVVCKIT